MIAERERLEKKIFYTGYVTIYPQLFLGSDIRNTYRDGLGGSSGRNTEQELMSPVTGYITPARMATIVEAGGNVAFKDPNDAVIIYKDLVALLNYWEHKALTSVHEVDIPIDYLERLDAFAEYLFNDYEHYGALEHRKRVEKERKVLQARPIKSRRGRIKTERELEERKNQPLEIKVGSTMSNRYGNTAQGQSTGHVSMADRIAIADIERKRRNRR